MNNILRQLDTLIAAQIAGGGKAEQFRVSPDVYQLICKAMLEYFGVGFGKDFTQPSTYLGIPIIIANDAEPGYIMVSGDAV